MEGKMSVLSKLEAAITECTARCNTQHGVIQLLQNKIDDLENRSRQHNLVFYGIPDTSVRESWSQSESLVKEVCSTKLQVNPETIEKAHRLGKFREGKTRPVIARFGSLKEKHLILGKAKNLKDTGIGMSEDFSEPVRKKRRILWQFARENRSGDARVQLKHDTLHMDGIRYTYDDTSGKVVQCK